MHVLLVVDELLCDTCKVDMTESFNAMFVLVIIVTFATEPAKSRRNFPRRRRR